MFDSGLKAKKSAKKPMLSVKNVRNRVNLFKKYKYLTVDMYENVMFSEESTFTRTFEDGICRRSAKSCPGDIQ